MVAKAITVSKQEIEALKERLQGYEQLLSDRGGVMRYVLGTRHHEWFNSWAEDLEKGIEFGIIALESPKKIANYIRLILKKAGYENAVPYLYEVLPAKYKEHPRDDENYENVIGNSSLNMPHIDPLRVLENKDWIALAYAWIDAIKLWIVKMQTGPWASLLPPEEAQQSMIMEYAAVQMMHEVLDMRQGVPMNTQHLLQGACLLLNTNDAGAYFFNHCKQKLDLTRKRTTQIVEGLIYSAMNDYGDFDFSKLITDENGNIRVVSTIKDVKGKLHLMFEPVDAEEARRKGFSMRECPQCGCLRTSRRYRTASSKPELFCWGCHHWWEYESDPLYVNPNARAINSYTCSECGHKGVVDEPANMPIPK